MRVAIYGFGEIGSVLAKKCFDVGFEIVSVVDKNPFLVGKSLKEFGIDCDVKVERSLRGEGDLAFVATGSYLDRVFDQIEDCVRKGFNVISTCETLAYPEFRYPELAERLDELAKEHGVTVLGTGINPGFLLDFLPIILSAPCVRVERVVAIRSVDALKRRSQFRRKIGLGLKVTEAEAGSVGGHVGYAESALLIAEGLRMNIDRVREGQELVLNKDRVMGIKGYASAFSGGREVVRVEFHAYANAPEFEEVRIFGDNPTVWRSDGTNGDLGTVAVLINLAKAVVDCKPGLIKMTDLVPFRRGYPRHP